jgi:hypothetical protein
VQDDLDALAAKRRELIRQSPTERVEAILASASPRRLVRALSPQELFLTLREAGLERAQPLLGHASRHQLDFLVDLEAWSSEGFDGQALARLVALLDGASDEAVARWLMESDEAGVVLGLSKLLHVYKADPSVDEETLPAGRELSSLDGIYYLEPTEACTEQAFLALWKGLQRVRAIRTGIYEALLEQAIWVIPAEQEEAAYEARVSRLAERGFPPLDEAMEVWAAGRAELEAARARASRALPESDRPGPARVPRPAPGVAAALPVSVGAASFDRVSLAMSALDEPERDRWLHDLVRLGNRFAVASLRPLSDLETHRDGLRQALSHAQLGLELLGGPEAGLDRLAALCREAPVFELARAGTAAINQRAARARELLQGWLGRVAHALERLDEAQRLAVEGLAAARPAYGLAEPPRPFRRVAELDEVDGILETLEGLGRFLERGLGAEAGREIPELRPADGSAADPAETPWHAVALTTLARAALDGPARPEPFPPAELPRALEALHRLFATPDELERASEALELGPALAWLMDIHADQLAGLDPRETPDPRFVPALLTRPYGT